MKKRFLYLILLGIIATNFSLNESFGASSLTSAVKKYKMGNYTGCLQDAQAVAKNDPSNAVAYYYMAISYAQAGKKDEAILCYKKVLSLKPNAVLYKYANTGKLCLESPDKCSIGKSTDVDKAVKAPYGDGLTESVRSSIQQKRLNALKNEINKDVDVNNYEFRKYKDYSNQKSEAEPEAQVSAAASLEEKAPTNDEIVAALRVLNRAGLNPYAQMNPYAAMGGQNSQMAQMSAMMGMGNTQGNNNQLMNVLPFLLAQGQDKTQQGASGTNFNPQMIQTMIMNSMMPDFTINTDKDKN